MAILNDIKRMQGEGKTEQEIISGLRQQGISARDIIDALSQSKIKEAVGTSETPTPYEVQQPQDIQQEALMPAQEEGADIIPSAAEPMTQEYASEQQGQMTPSAQYSNQQYAQPQPEQGQGTYQDYQQYAQPQGNISPDTITEISEQVVSEKLSPLKKDLENAIDLKNTLETKIDYLDDRLKRIEKIIDRLNLSIMQKVGDYMTNIDDIKNELIETQKSFKSLVPALNMPKISSEKSKKVAEQ